MKLQLDRTIKAGDILTTITVLVSVAALLLSLAKDRDARISEQANKVRSAAAVALVKLDRRQALQLSLYQDLQPNFVDLSETLAQKYDVVAIRDKFWREVNIERARIARQVLDEQLDTAYTDVLTHFPAARTRFVMAVTKLADIEAQSTFNFLAEGEQGILSFKGKQANYQSAYLGNALRQAALTHSQQLKTRTEAVIAPVREYLFGVIGMNDSEIVNTSRTK